MHNWAASLLIYLHRGTPLQYRHLHVSHVCRRYKKKWVEMGRKKVLPRELALSYFDTYYPQIYGEKYWKEMRLALMFRKKKYCALVNNFADHQKTTENLMLEQEAYDMFSLVGKKFKVQHHTTIASEDSASECDTVSLDDVTDHEIPQRPPNKWEMMAVDLSDSAPGIVDYEETPEGFMVPKKGDDELPTKPYHPPDLYDYVPADKRITAKEQLERDLERQTLMLGLDPGIDILPAESLMIPPMLKCSIHETGNIKSFYSPKQDSTKMLQYYLMDGASILPVLALNIKPGDKILDLCAAPGGKSLAMAQTLLPESIVCVDSSMSRLNRLKDTFKWYIPGVLEESEYVETSIHTIHGDGRTMGDKHPTLYDKVLVDAPCNTDRDVLTNDEDNRFKRSRVTERLQLPELQTALLISGLKACKPGGVVVYSTCTLTPGQNDYVVEHTITQLRESHPHIKVKVQDCSDIVDRLGHLFQFWAGSRYGQVVLPISSANFGPGYFAKLVRVE